MERWPATRPCYAYGGQQVDDGMPFYVSIFDQKTPGAAYLAALAVGIGNVLGVPDLEAIRVMFFVCACLTVVAVYLLALELWGSVVAALVAAVTFAAFRGFAIDALGGPDAKTPGILLAVLSMWLIARRRWFWAGLCGALAFLVWQPLLIYLAVALAVAARRGSSWRARRSRSSATAAYFGRPVRSARSSRRRSCSRSRACTGRPRPSASGSDTSSPSCTTTTRARSSSSGWASRC